MGSDGKELMVVIRLEGEQVGARKDEVKDFVRMMATVANIQLKNEAVEVVKDPYQWTLIQDARHGWRGDIMVKLAKKEEVLHMFGALDGKSINVSDGGQI
eukprot:15756357-Heterocapsa_arctica.AAC.1